MHTPEAIEASFIFFPQPQLRGDPSHVGLQHEDVWLTADDGNKTHAWFIHGEESDAPQSKRIRDADHAWEWWKHQRSTRSVSRVRDEVPTYRYIRFGVPRIRVE